jgi:hypothetical protein
MPKNSGVDNKKRLFLKLAGMVGVGAVASLFFPKKAQALVFGSTPASNVVGLKDTGNVPITPAKTGQLPVALTDTTGYLKVAILGGAADGVLGANVGIKNAAETRINPATNEGLATLAQDESILLLRRIVKQLEASATVDKSNRQRVVLDGIGTGSTGVTTELAAVLPVIPPAAGGAAGYQSGIGYGQPIQAMVATEVSTPVLTLTPVLTPDGLQAYDPGTGEIIPPVWVQSYDPITGEMVPPVVTTVLSPGGDTPYSTNTLASSWYSQVTEGLIDQRWRVAEESHIAYQRVIRSQITIS